MRDRFRSVAHAGYAVASGAVDIAMAVGVEKLKDSGFSGLLRPSIPSDGTGGTLGTTSAPANFSLLGPAYAKKYGVTPDEFKDVITRIAWKNHHNGALNSRAQFRQEVSKETIERSPLVAGQLGVIDCSGVSDGAAAAIVIRADDAHKYTDKPLYIKALSLVSGDADGTSTPSTTSRRFPKSSPRRATPTPRPDSLTRLPRSQWPRCTTASPSPS